MSINGTPSGVRRTTGRPGRDNKAPFIVNRKIVANADKKIAKLTIVCNDATALATYLKDTSESEQAIVLKEWGAGGAIRPNGRHPLISTVQVQVKYDDKKCQDPIAGFTKPSKTLKKSISQLSTVASKSVAFTFQVEAFASGENSVRKLTVEENTKPIRTEFPAQATSSGAS